MKSWLGALAAIGVLELRPGLTLPVLCHELAAEHGDQPALLGEQNQLTFAALGERMNKYARWALAQALKPGETICLLMPNCPEYPCIWLGVSQIGCAVALLNTSLTIDALVHCIKAASSRHIIFAASFVPVMQAVSKLLPRTTQYWVHGQSAVPHPFARIDQIVEAYLPAAPAMDMSRQPAGQDIALLVYTSGTTGLPKAARLTHGRVIEWSFWFAGLLNIKPSDRLYDCLPLYHSTGGIVALGAMLVRGGSVVIRERFSASRFWDDIIDEKCSIFFYIGELCRYLTQMPPNDRASQHRLRLCCGNGLGARVWEVFQARFAIPRIIEFYAATEGSVSLYNCTGRPGAIGHVPGYLKANFPVILVKTDALSGEILRNGEGLCEICQPDEVGEALGRITSASHLPSRQFDGYTDQYASGRKVLLDVLRQGDAWFRTGDLMRLDDAGYYYFVERLGDTFRWKGENVSTEEVAKVLRECAGIKEAVVFGVTIPGFEGRAGMAAITVDDSFSFAELLIHVEQHLPDYARPLFTRICKDLEKTGTFKYKKSNLAQEGFLPPSEPDAVWLYDRASHAFIHLDEALRQKISAGSLSRF